MDRIRLTIRLAAAGVLLSSSLVLGQGFGAPSFTIPEPAMPLTEDQARALLESDLTPQQREKARLWNKARVENEKRMKLIRHKHFGSKAVPEIRQAGIAELRTVTDPSAFPSMLEIYRHERADVLDAVCAHLADLNSDESLSTLAYAAVYEKQPAFRSRAALALKDAVHSGRPVPAGVHTVVASGLASSVLAYKGDAARLAASLKLIEAIPAMIAGQISAVGGGGSAGGYLAYIVVGTQRAYVADLEPVVGNGSVAFDPIPGVLTEGAVLAINDAVVVQYSTGVHDALVGLTSELSGEDTARLGWDPRRWQEWYANTLLPKLERDKEDRKKRDATKPTDATAVPKPKRKVPIAV